jgi:hypothetical protein
MRRFVALTCGVLSACGHPAAPGKARGPERGWEGFYQPGRVTDDWLRGRGIPLSAAAVQRAARRVAKLVIADGPKEAPPDALARMQRRYCGEPAVRAWNEKRCSALERRRCRGRRCTYDHFGNCSGLLLGGGLFLTAAHCVAGLHRDPALADASEILVPGEDPSLPAGRLPLGPMVLGKHELAHDWAVQVEQDPVDAAMVLVEDGGLAPYPRGPTPPIGAPVFLVGYPRAERRPAAARARHGYGLVFGTPAASFGRLTQAPHEGRPLCSVDGKQEHWALTRPCPSNKLAGGYRGVITHGAFVTSLDVVNGFSGAPVLDGRGRLVGVNVTVVGGIDPQDRYGSGAVGVALGRVLARLRPETFREGDQRPELDTAAVDAWLSCRHGGGPAAACRARSSRTVGGRIAELSRGSFVSDDDGQPDPAVDRVATLVRSMRGWRLSRLARGVAALLPRPAPGRFRIYVVANGHPMGDAYVRKVSFRGETPTLTRTGEPVVVLNALAIAAGYRGAPADQARSALGVVRHELFHALYATSGVRHSASTVAARLLELTLNEGVAHFVDRRRRLQREGFPADRARAALAALAAALARAEELKPGSPEARELLGRAGEGRYWEKHGAIGGMLLAYGVYRAFGVPGIRQALRCGPGRLIALYRRARLLEPDLPALPSRIRRYTAECPDR